MVNHYLALHATSRVSYTPLSGSNTSLFTMHNRTKKLGTNEWKFFSMNTRITFGVPKINFTLCGVIMAPSNTMKYNINTGWFWPMHSNSEKYSGVKLFQMVLPLHPQNINTLNCVTLIQWWWFLTSMPKFWKRVINTLASIVFTPKRIILQSANSANQFTSYWFWDTHGL